MFKCPAPISAFTRSNSSCADFSDSYAKPIQKYGDSHVAERFRKVTAPFMMRRLKTDKSIISDLPDKIERVLSDKERVQWFANKMAACKDVFFIGRGLDYAISLEGSLKMKEISYIHSEAYAAGASYLHIKPYALFLLPLQHSIILL